MAGMATLSASALLLTACGAAPEAGSTATEGASDYTGCIVSDSGGFDDQSFNQAGSEGLEQAKAELGITATEVESSADTDYAPNIDNLVQQGCNLVIGVGFLLEDRGDRGSSVPDGPNGEPRETERRRQEITDVRFVVNDENLGSVSHAP